MPEHSVARHERSDMPVADGELDPGCRCAHPGYASLKVGHGSPVSIKVELVAPNDSPLDHTQSLTAMSRMKMFLVVCAFLTWLLMPDEGRSQSAGDMFRYCTGSDTTLSTMCGLYMAGFMNGVSFEQTTRGNGAQKICMPNDITGERVKEVFEGFMRDYPKLQNDPRINKPEIIIGMALLRAYPCPKGAR